MDQYIQQKGNLDYWDAISRRLDQCIDIALNLSKNCHSGVLFCTWEHFGIQLAGVRKNISVLTYLGISASAIKHGMEKLKNYYAALNHTQLI